eukprot:3802091-Pleurochrysis_carterae.AAC.1
MRTAHTQAVHGEVCVRVPPAAADPVIACTNSVSLPNTMRSPTQTSFARHGAPYRVESEEMAPGPVGGSPKRRYASQLL